MGIDHSPFAFQVPKSVGFFSKRLADTRKIYTFAPSIFETLTQAMPGWRNW
jgi:hypothetical protein